MKYRVIEEHKSNNSNPINVKKGEKVKLGRISSEADGWCNWVYCFSLGSDTEGWIPEQMVKVENEYGILLNDYSAKELEVNKNNIIDGDIEFNGWLWCSKLNETTFGWIPNEKIVELQEY